MQNTFLDLKIFGSASMETQPLRAITHEFVRP